MKILVLNCGSSSLKYQLIDMINEKVLAKGYFEKIGLNESFLTHRIEEQKYLIEKPVFNHVEAIKIVLEQLMNSKYGVISNLDEIGAVGHRTVHGGEKFNGSVVITDEVINTIKECSDLAPLHNPAALLGINACKEVMPDKKMVAVFDTAFHQTIPEKAYIYPIPYKYYEKYKIRKYGFHGTSHKYVSIRVAELMQKPVEELKTIVCHLGQGASLCAIKHGKSLDTSMGLTPLAGISMGTRCGDIDPSIVTFLMKNEKLTIEQIEKILNKESGALGISEVSFDNRDIEAEASKGNKKAKLSLDSFQYIVAQYIGKYLITLGGADTIIFTAGIGENSPETRLGICSYLEFLGIKIDKEKNTIRGEEVEISTNDSKIKVFVIPTNEELMIARDTLELIK